MASPDIGATQPTLRPNRRSAASLQELLIQMVDCDDERPQGMRTEEEGSFPRRQMSAPSLQALLDEMENNRQNIAYGASSIHVERPLTRNAHSAASLQRLLGEAEDPGSPSVVPASGVYSTTPVVFVRTAVLSASFRDLLSDDDNDDENNDNTPTPRLPWMRRESSKEDDALDTVGLSEGIPVEPSREVLTEALDDVLDFL
ncbi:hypothetical protein IV203_016021 [Nitzschia inconspicua]|uniref:Uncharacterized protein n=1 Tax=Nitzschia inconspicua TaxID=303405 RepID=A0A9K3KPY3_9STRA|nr:hypothetical protein IV203_016021 [Nitzschia inconspicua]